MSAGITLLIDSDLDKIALVARAVRAVCQDALNADDADAVELSLVEAMTNVIKHGYEGRPGQDLRVALSLQADRLVVEIVDHAHPMKEGLLDEATPDRFDFDETNLEDLPESGMGLALIRMNMDEVEYSSSGGENRLRMVKRIGAPQP